MCEEIFQFTCPNCKCEFGLVKKATLIVADIVPQNCFHSNTVVTQPDQLTLFARFISNNSKLASWMSSDELLKEFKKQH